MNYALISGASRGIGRSIAESLARRGYPLLLVARSADQLESLADSIRSRYRLPVQVLATDLTAPGAAQKVFTWCVQNQYKVEVLVNNAGYGLSGPFEKWSLQDHQNLMQLNMDVPVAFCHLFLPMLRQSPKAYILNIASNAAYQAVPYLSTYAGSKAFLLSFSRGLRQELRKSPVSVTCICPGPTDTDFVLRAAIGEKGVQTAKKVHMSADQVGELSVRAMLAGKAEIIPGLLNKITGFAVWLLPKGFIERTAMKIYE